MIALNETLLSGKMKINLPPFAWWTITRKDIGGGGVATGIAQQYKDLAMGAREGKEEDQYLITRVESFSPALNVINCYGEQRKI